MADKLVTIATFWESWEAHLAKDRLLDAGINCFLSGVNFVATYWLYANADRGIKLKVVGSNAAKAGELLEGNGQIETDETANSDLQAKGDNDVCPKCQSADIKYERFSRNVFFLSILLLGFPLPFPGKHYRCKSCRHAWR